MIKKANSKKIKLRNSITSKEAIENRREIKQIKK